ncbi:hypothetical protein GE061_010498 [Apolygus lucorum]|uniref:Reverse transcriptase domain-containing protein n=1 Tax=Apolygus lucorum TaxID=248454 RepID=A0A8S9XW73_APOLU|nr:hypothetical protein GE061_010498 [Apolygus lucorum]
MGSRSLSLAIQKTEIVLLTRKRIDRNIQMLVDGQSIITSDVIKYLGVMLDVKLSFWAHICKAADRAAAVVGRLGRLMANIGGPSPSKRRLLMRTTDAILLYGAEVWADALKFQKYRTRIESVQRRGALRICSGYRTVSAPAVQVVAGVTPIDLLADERRRIHLRKAENAPTVVKKEEREETMRRWQNRWRSESRGRWTARLIHGVKEWTERVHGEVNYYLTQFLTGHGYFWSFLKKIGRTTDSRCLYCQQQRDRITDDEQQDQDGVAEGLEIEEDDVYHTHMCPRWERMRSSLIDEVGELQPETIVNKMMETKENWDAINTYVMAVLKEKERNRDWEGLTS